MVIRKYAFIEWLKTLFCKHEHESNGITPDTWCEVHAWCKKCGKAR